MEIEAPRRKIHLFAEACEACKKDPEIPLTDIAEKERQCQGICKLTVDRFFRFFLVCISSLFAQNSSFMSMIPVNDLAYSLKSADGDEFARDPATERVILAFPFRMH